MGGTNVKASIIITAFQRPHLLNWGLYSIARQHIPFNFETIVVNDGLPDETEAVCAKYREKLNLTYIFSGERNLGGKVDWRVPGYAINIGAKRSAGEVLILTCAEMYHINDTIARLVFPLLVNSRLIGRPEGIDDTIGSFLDHITANNGELDLGSFECWDELPTWLPFLISVSRDKFFSIGGYDEDFTGIGWDDNDIMDRLLMSGCSYFQTDAKTIHLFHPRYAGGKDDFPVFRRNMNLYLGRKGKVVRNENREWGTLNASGKGEIMKKYSIVGMCQIYNEMDKGNLERFVKYFKPVVDALVVYDDGSTDGSYEYMLQHTPYVIRGNKNDFANERSHKQVMLAETLKLAPDFILWLDADEVLTVNAIQRLQEMCAYCIENQVDGLCFHELNIWRGSHTWRRTDSLFNDGWFVRLWRVTPDMAYHDAKPGLHQASFPSTMKILERYENVPVLHYGFSSEKNLSYKYLVYRSHGQRGYEMLDRLINEEQLVVERVPKELFPEGLWVEDEAPTAALSFEDALNYVEGYREKVFRPNYSIICVIQKNLDWLKFSYNQIMKYTDMKDKELFFVAVDPNEAVLSYLRDNYIPHYVLAGTPQQKADWNVNNIYRAYNYGASKARGDFLVFTHSDIAFTPGWLESLMKGYNGFNCVTPRVIESGKKFTGTYGVLYDFGKTVESFREQDFLDYAATAVSDEVKDGGLFCPLVVRRSHFEQVGGFPEGNVLSSEGQPCISGYEFLLKKLEAQGISHQTAFGSVVYHFQSGETEAPETVEVPAPKIKIAVCAESLKGASNDKTLWASLLELLPASVGIDQEVLGNNHDFAENARTYIRCHYPDVKVIIQDATSTAIVDESLYTIAFLRDNLRDRGLASERQENNLRLAHRIVCDSVKFMISYPEYDFDVITTDRLHQWKDLMVNVFQKLKD